MTEKDAEQQRLTANGSSSSGTADDSEAANGAGTASAAATYGALSSPSAGTAAPTPEVNGSAGNGLGNIYGEEDGNGSGPRGSIVGDNSISKARSIEDARGAVEGFCPATDERSGYNGYGIVPVHGEEEIRAHLARATSSSSIHCVAGCGGCGGGGFELTFRGRSPKFIRFGVLLLITLLPFGAHFVKSCFSSLETYFLEDPKLHFNETKYGSVMSAISIPNLFMPFFGGVFLDSKGHNKGIMIFLTLELVGHVVFTVAMGWGNFWMAIAGEALHGFGSGAVVVAMRAVVSKFFLENELTFALGVTIAGACVSKTLAKASVAPIAETKWGYMGALWYVALWQLLSLIAGLVYIRLAASARGRLGMELVEVEHKDLRVRSLLVAMEQSTLSFWLVSVLHTLLIIAYHLFANYSGHFLFENYHVSPVLAGYLSALMPLVVVICAPLAGLVLDRWGRQLYVLLAANVITIITYICLLQDRVGPVICILTLAFCESFVPTILLSALPLTVHPCIYGAAFGMAEVLSAIATIVANVFFGYSRDTTSSYKQDLRFLVILCFVCLAITVFLVFWDARDGRPVLNRAKRLLRADVKVLG